MDKQKHDTQPARNGQQDFNTLVRAADQYQLESACASVSQKQQYKIEQEKIADAVADALPGNGRTAERLSNAATYKRIVSAADAKFKPLHSWLVDTVRMRIKMDHDNLFLCPNTRSARKHMGFIVTSKFGTTATVFSSRERDYLTIELSVPKFLTGQNLIGIADVRRACLDGIKGVLKRMGLRPTSSELRRLKKLDFDLYRVDFAVHCESPRVSWRPVGLSQPSTAEV